MNEDGRKGVGADVGGVREVEGLDTPKHETSVPFSTEKGIEIAFCPPAAMAEN